MTQSDHKCDAFPHMINFSTNKYHIMFNQITKLKKIAIHE